MSTIDCPKPGMLPEGTELYFHYFYSSPSKKDSSKREYHFISRDMITQSGIKVRDLEGIFMSREPVIWADQPVLAVSHEEIEKKYHGQFIRPQDFAIPPKIR